MPTSSSSAATCSAAFRSPGPDWSPKLEVSCRIRSLQSWTTSAAGSYVMTPSCPGSFVLVERRSGDLGLRAVGGQNETVLARTSERWGVPAGDVPVLGVLHAEVGDAE